MSSPTTIFKDTPRYDQVKGALIHALDFWLGGKGSTCVAVDPLTLKVAVERRPADTGAIDYYRWFMTTMRHERGGKDYQAALRMGPCHDGETGLLAIQFDNRGSYVPKLPVGRYGPEHTYIGNALLITKRVIIDSVNYPPRSFAVLFGYFLRDFPHGLHSCLLQQHTLDSMGPVRLLAEGSYLPIEPAGDRRFYTPLIRLNPSIRTDEKHRNTLHGLGIVTLNGENLVELLTAFDPAWTPSRGLQHNT